MARRATSDALDRLDRAHLVHGFGSPAVAEADGAMRLVRGKGVYVWDHQGRRYIDGLASLWNVAVGHGRGEIAHAVGAQIRALAHHATADAEDIADWLGVPVAVAEAMCADLEATGLVTPARGH